MIPGQHLIPVGLQVRLQARTQRVHPGSYDRSRFSFWYQIGKRMIVSCKYGSTLFFMLLLGFVTFLLMNETQSCRYTCKRQMFYSNQTAMVWRCGGVAVCVCWGEGGGGSCNDGNVGFLRWVNKLYLWQTPKQQEFEEKKTNTFYFCSL